MAKILKKAQTKLTDQQRIEFAKQLEYFYEINHADLKKVFIFSLLKGIATGLGVFLGGTLVVGLVLWLLSLFDGLPLIGEIFEATKNSIEENP